MLIFDTMKKRQQRWRARHALQHTDYLHQAACEFLLEPLINGSIAAPFPNTLELGARHGIAAQYLQHHFAQCSITHYTHAECEPRWAELFHYPHFHLAEEELLHLPPQHYNLILSILNLHWVNDLPGVLIQIQQALAPKGLFMGVLLGGQTLQELRHALTLAEAEVYGGLSPRISPFTEVKDCGMLLQRAGFTLPVSESNLITVKYKHVLQLLQDLRAMGETAALIGHAERPLTRHMLERTQHYYAHHYGDGAGNILATFECISLVGWSS